MPEACQVFGHVAPYDMALRLGGIADLDPTAVPLPAGTEVTTRVDRVVDGGVGPEGASARGTQIAGEHVDGVFLDGKRGR